MAIPSERDPLTDQVIGFAIEVHRQLGPGLLESAYEECLCYELNENRLAFKRQVPLPVIYKSVRLDCGYRIDVVVENRLILELKAADRLMPIHEAQVLTYMRLSGHTNWSVTELQHTCTEGWHQKTHAVRPERSLAVSLSRCEILVGEGNGNG